MYPLHVQRMRVVVSAALFLRPLMQIEEHTQTVFYMPSITKVPGTRAMLRTPSLIVTLHFRQLYVCWCLLLCECIFHATYPPPLLPKKDNRIGTYFRSLVTGATGSSFSWKKPADWSVCCKRPVIVTCSSTTRVTTMRKQHNGNSS